MTANVIFVNLAALTLIAWIVWYFWLSEKPAIQAALAGGVQEAYIRVKGGYDPDLVVVEAGRPVRLHFDRQESASCSEMVVFPDFGISRQLPDGETVTIDLDALEAGEYATASHASSLSPRLPLHLRGLHREGTGDGAGGRWRRSGRPTGA
jgi:plastocyanin domain-containing protein